MDISVVTYGSGYSYDIYDRFIGSLNNTGFSGTIYIIVKQNDLPVLNKLQYKNIIACVDDIEQTTHINNHRFFCIQKVLPDIKSEYIFVCDFRDVLFQKNIELYPHDSSDLYVFAESIKLKNEQHFNTPWLKQLEKLFNEKFYDSISDNSILCCGTTFGNYKAIKAYIDCMCEIIQEFNIMTNLDQGIHNYLFHLNKLQLNTKILTNEDNFVNTVGNDIHQLNTDNLIVNSKNEVSYVVHQYDRFSLDFKHRISTKLGFNFVS
jgi:hypothetical protein